MSIDLKEISAKWQSYWEENKTFYVDEDKDKEKFYVLDMFPYPSGVGLHIGHTKWYIATDVIAKKNQLGGKNVLHPMGWDAFWLPAENYAMKNKVHPSVSTNENIATFTKQGKSVGLGYDWSREINTTDPEFYKWSQWIFLKLYNSYYNEELNKAMPIANLQIPTRLSEEEEREFKDSQRLAFVDHKPINWCPECKTGLANEDLEDGKCERCESEIEQKPMRQWVLRITKYANRLLEDIGLLDQWEDSIKEMQKNWIGKSVGAEFDMTISTIPEETEHKDELTFKIIGVAMEAHKKFGNAAKEEEYKSYIKSAFEKDNISVDMDIDMEYEQEIKTKKKREFKKQGFKKKKKEKIVDKRVATRTLQWVVDLVIDWKIAVKLKFKDENKREPTQKLSSFVNKESNINAGLVLNFYKGKLDYKRLEKVVEEMEDAPQISVYTTRLDTVFGMTFVAMSPEHPLIDEITTDEYREKVEAYKEQANKKTALERTELQKDKTGVFCGAYAINPFNDEKVPVYIADYVLANYGTGVVMAVPAHDERDWDFAMKYNLPIRQSVLREWIDYRSLFKMLDIIEHINYLAEENNIKVYLAGGFAVAFTNGVYYRNNKDIDFVVEKWKADHLKELLRKNNFAYVADYEFRKDEISIQYGEIGDIVEYAPKVEYELHSKIVDKRIYSLIGHESRSVTRRFLLDYKDLQIKSRNKEHDLEALAQLKNGATTEYGILVNSWEFSGITSEKAKNKLLVWAEENEVGRKKENFRLQDWVFSRQRYWGEPIPMIHCEKCGVQDMDEKDLPLVLPDVEHYEPTGTEEWPLANIDEWINTKCPSCGGPAKRESNTMPQWAGSSWYWLRYMDAKNDAELVSPEKEAYWNQVDCYVGGAEHATRHLIYGRFWHKFLQDIGVVSTPEPFKKLQHVWLVLGTDGQKISKRAGNGVDPLDIVNEYGADTLRVYQMFMWPFDQAVAFDMNGVKWAKRFLDKVIKLYDNVSEDAEDDKKIVGLLHKTIKKVGEDIDDFKFNTAISQMMILVKELANQDKISKDLFEKFVLIIAPFAPHLAEELWEKLWYKTSIFDGTKWPTFDEKLIVEDTIIIAVQVMGKVRSTIEIDKDTSKEDVLSKAKEAVDKWIDGKEIEKEIYVSGKIVNLLVK